MAQKQIKPLVAGNWKMNGLLRDLAEAARLAKRVGGVSADVMLCPPATLLAPMAERVRGSKIKLGAQDCHSEKAGAHTGDLSAAMLKEAGASAVILGHSERRADHNETDKLVRGKVAAAWGAGLMAIVCVGESLAQRKKGETLKQVRKQLRASLPDASTAKNLVVAYEPIWAIGSGRTPTLDEVAEVHNALRKSLVARFGDVGAGIRLLYGGSVKPSNAAELMAVENVNGALVGGASLKAKDFCRD